MNKLENVRSFFTSDLKVRALNGNEKGVGEVSGYAVVFNQPSEFMGFYEIIDPKAFENVDMTHVLALYDHNYDNILARVDSNTLQLSVDKQGVAFKMTLPDTTIGRDVYENVRNGNLKGMSFGFTVDKEDWSQNDKGEVIHTVIQIGRFTEISICALPAYTETSVAVSRSLNKFSEETYKKKVGLFLNALERNDNKNVKN